MSSVKPVVLVPACNRMLGQHLFHSTTGTADPGFDGDTFVAHGRTRYLTDDRSGVDREFANIFVTRFDADGRCREFTEWFMRRRPEVLPDE